MNPVVLLVGGFLLVMALSKKSGPAAELARKLAADITKRQYDYSRALCKQFQIAAGFSAAQADGIYGPSTAAALAKYTSAPKALFKGASGTKKAAPKKTTAPALAAR